MTLLKDLRALGRVKAPASVLTAVQTRVGLGAGATDRYVTTPSAIGSVFVAFNDHGVTAVMRAASPRAFVRAYARARGRPVRRAKAAPPWRTAPRVDLGALSAFQRAVLCATMRIPRGQVRTYTWLAREVGRPGAARAVGSALAANPAPLLIPCHRVVRTDGRIGDFVFGSAAKRSLLASEGVDPDTLERQPRSGVRYVGSDTTRIYCFPTCRAARRITERHRVPFRSARHAAGAGYRPCRLCRPAAA